MKVVHEYIERSITFMFERIDNHVASHMGLYMLLFALIAGAAFVGGCVLIGLLAGNVGAGLTTGLAFGAFPVLPLIGRVCLDYQDSRATRNSHGFLDVIVNGPSTFEPGVTAEYYHRVESSHALIRAAFAARDGATGNAHTRYAAALLPGDERGVTTLVLAKWKSGSHAPSVCSSEQVKVGADPDADVFAHIAERFYTLKNEAHDLETESYLALPARYAQRELTAFAVDDEIANGLLAKKQQRIIATIS